MIKIYYFPQQHLQKMGSKNSTPENKYSSTVTRKYIGLTPFPANGTSKRIKLIILQSFEEYSQHNFEIHYLQIAASCSQLQCQLQLNSIEVKRYYMDSVNDYNNFILFTIIINKLIEYIVNDYKDISLLHSNNVPQCIHQNECITIQDPQISRICKSFNCAREAFNNAMIILKSLNLQQLNVGEITHLHFENQLFNIAKFCDIVTNSLCEIETLLNESKC